MAPFTASAALFPVCVHSLDLERRGCRCCMSRLSILKMRGGKLSLSSAGLLVVLFLEKTYNCIRCYCDTGENGKYQ